MMTPVFTVILGLTVMGQTEDVASAQAAAVRQYPMTGRITGDAVNVRSGPGTNYYITHQLNSADPITVEGYEIGWYMIAPPPGSFSLIHKDYLNVSGEEGVVTGNAVRIRAGSEFTPQRYAIQTKANKGDRFKVLGVFDGWYKVVPPLGAHLYVSEQFVDFTDTAIASVMSNAVKESTDTTEFVAISETSGTIVKDSSVAETTVVVEERQVSLLSDAVGGTEVTQITETTSITETPAITELSPTSPDESGFTALDHYRAAEEALVRESQKPAFTREYGPLLARYEGLAGMADTEIVGSYAQQRIRWIERQMAISANVAAIDRLHAEQDQARLRLAQEQAALHESRAEFEQEPHTAIGIIEPSFVFTEPGNQRWRLVDPQTRQTLFYLEKTDPLMSFETMAGRTVGVQGETVYEPTNKVRIIRVTDITQR